MARPPDGKSIGQYVIGKSIGEGTFGKVKLGTHILTGEKVAVKILEKSRIIEVADVERVAREIHILKMLRHPHIIQLYEIIETSRQLYLLMEYASGGELFDYIVKHQRVQEVEACKFFRQIITAVEKIHDMRVAHRDLKPENLLLDDNQNIKIVDFGLSNTYTGRLRTACGSPCYAAPEMIAGHEYVPLLSDIWSCGVILFTLVCGYLPFEDPSTPKLYDKILRGDYTAPDHIGPMVADLIRAMLTTDPTKRLRISGIRAHPWYRGCLRAGGQPDIVFREGGCGVVTPCGCESMPSPWSPWVTLPAMSVAEQRAGDVSMLAGLHSPSVTPPMSPHSLLRRTQGLLPAKTKSDLLGLGVARVMPAPEVAGHEDEAIFLD